MRLTVLIPTYRRPTDLERCLVALRAQERTPDDVIVVARADDRETAALLALRPADPVPVRTAIVAEPGQVAALNTGLRAADGDVIAILDDDTAPWPDWLSRIEAHFQRSPRLGGLGGRDMIRADGFPAEPDTRQVGRLTWYGRWTGQAHRGVGPPREVELLKGCNMSFRRTAITGVWFDPRLLGSGAQWFNDAAFSLAVKRAGWQVVYDPAVRVDHYLGARHGGDDRTALTPGEVYAVVYNETLILLEHLSPLRRLMFLGYGITVGTRRAPGLLQWVRARLPGGHPPSGSHAAAWKGRLAAWREYRRGHARDAAADRREAVSL